MEFFWLFQWINLLDSQSSSLLGSLKTLKTLKNIGNKYIYNIVKANEKLKRKQYQHPLQGPTPDITPTQCFVSRAHSIIVAGTKYEKWQLCASWCYIVVGLQPGGTPVNFILNLHFTLWVSVGVIGIYWIELRLNINLKDIQNTGLITCQQNKQLVTTDCTRYEMRVP